LEEAKTINKSLTTLGKVIVALTDKKATHIPYRESKLTRILQESLGGNSRTALIITCSPHPYNGDETLSTLRFGARARNIKNQPKVNREYTVAELKRLLDKAEADLDIQKCKVKALESIIVELGGEVPREELLQAKIVQQQIMEEEVLTAPLQEGEEEENKEEIKLASEEDDEE
jgi:kinesin family protein 5